MRPLKKFLFFLVLFFYFSLNGSEVEAQLFYHNFSSFPEINNDYQQESMLTKPRRGFTKRRYGRHTFFAEGGYFFGYYTGIRFSLNYDILVQSGESNAFTLRLGYGINQAKNDSTYKGNEAFVPIGANILLGRKNLIEVGAGIFYYLERQKPIPYFSLGFRHQNPKGGLTYRVAFDVNFERSYDVAGREIGKTGVFGPLVGLGYTF
jgi:hypothetical protein